MVLAYRCDLNHDWKVDEQDLAVLNAAIDANDLSGDIAPAKKRDGKVDANDLALLTQYLGTVIPEMGLIAHWALDETAGTIAHDSAPQPHDGTVLGSPLWRPEDGKVGGALELSGVVNFVMTPFVRDPSQGPFSVFAWVKGSTPGQAILGQIGGVTWLMADTNTGALMTELKDAGRLSKNLSSPVVITDDNWHRVGFVWDGCSRKLYVDNVVVAEDPEGPLVGSTGGLYIGAGSKPLPGTLWKGLIDDVRIYDRAIKP